MSCLLPFAAVVAHLLPADPVTQCTPMLHAIYGRHADVVRELLAAGAYPAPPHVTQDPAIQALLLPAHQHHLQAAPPPPQAFLASPPTHPGHFAPMSPPGPGREAQFFQPMPFMPMHAQEGHPQFVPYGAAPAPGPGPRRREGKEGGGLPPAEQAKQIPCRNFPNCRWVAVLFSLPAREQC